MSIKYHREFACMREREREEKERELDVKHKRMFTFSLV